MKRPPKMKRQPKGNGSAETVQLFPSCSLSSFSAFSALFLHLLLTTRIAAHAQSKPFKESFASRNAVSSPKNFDAPPPPGAPAGYEAKRVFPNVTFPSLL